MSKVTNLIPPKLSVEVVFSEPSGDDRLDAAETAELIITVSNKGKGSAFGLEIETLIDENSKINFSSISYIGEIPSGEKRSKRLKLNANADIETGESVITLKFKEQNGFAPNDQRIKFFTEAFIPPDLVIVDYGIEDFDMDARITPGETVMIIVRVQNLGAGTAEDVKAFVNRNSTNIFFYGNSQSSFSLDALNPGDYSDISFDIVSNRDAVDMPITISITESTGQFGVKDHPLNLQFNQVQKRVSEITISPKKVLTQMYDPSMGLSIDIENNIPIAKKQNKNALAVIFGIEQYKNVPGATFAKRDAAIVKNYFDTSLGIPQNRTYYQTNEDVTKAEFEKVFSKGGWLDKRLKEDSDVYVFYAGHGAPYVDNKEAYLIPYDGDPNYPTQTGFSLESLYENLGQLNARSVTVVLDACFTGANREEQALLANARPVYIKIKKPSARGLTVYSASGNQEISSAYPEKKHGLFTYFFLKGLQGDADRNNDNMISVDELGIFVANKVSEKAVEFDREQTPEMQSNDGSRILVKY
ncbi:MAG: hypothetical protein HOI47_31765 [Candidatus Scalindua sp.]|nr:hypothetical protein [Candidatus Scalindua sp.]